MYIFANIVHFSGLQTIAVIDFSQHGKDESSHTNCVGVYCYYTQLCRFCHPAVNSHTIQPYRIIHVSSSKNERKKDRFGFKEAATIKEVTALPSRIYSCDGKTERKREMLDIHPFMIRNAGEVLHSLRRQRVAQKKKTDVDLQIFHIIQRILDSSAQWNAYTFVYKTIQIV